MAELESCRQIPHVQIRRQSFVTQGREEGSGFAEMGRVLQVESPACRIHHSEEKAAQQTAKAREKAPPSYKLGTGRETRLRVLTPLRHLDNLQARDGKTG